MSNALTSTVAAEISTAGFADVTLPIENARVFAPPVLGDVTTLTVRADSTPLEIWEGVVCDVDRTSGVMQVSLDAKIGDMPRHTGEIALESVSPQDEDLIKPGAVFYLTLYKRTLPNVENVEELRFRRRPSWSTKQLAQVERDAVMVMSKMKEPPVAHD